MCASYPIRRYEIDKLTASQRLDLNLEKGRMRDELQSLRDKTNELEIKVREMVASQGPHCACMVCCAPCGMAVVAAGQAE